MLHRNRVVQVARSRFACAGALVVAFSSAACGSADESFEEVRTVQAAFNANDPIHVCNQDPRVWMGLVPLQVCAGARVFFDETFDGNGRTCGTCHDAANNYTVDSKFVAALPANDPLFVADDPNFDLELLELPDLRGPLALIRENVDGFEDLEFKFVGRSVTHTISLATSIARDPGDGTSADFAERTGWGGDGAPGDGSLRSFLDGAINQHYPKDSSRTPGVSFRFATEAEKDQTLAFQLAVGRTADLNLASVVLNDGGAAQGRNDFLDPMRGRCNHCHANAGANFVPTGLNRNFDTGTTEAPSSFIELPGGGFLFDGGFGGQGLEEPNHVTVTGVPDAFGDGTFSTPPLIEAADTGPFFHTHVFGDVFEPTNGIEGAVGFYSSALFTNSPAAQELDAFFGAPIDLSGSAVQDIGRFLRVLNASFNLAQAIQRLQATHTLVVAFWGYREDIQKGLIELADEEVEDAIRVLSFGVETGGGNLHPAQQATLINARALLAAALATTNPAVRRDKAAAARAAIQTAKNGLGTGMNFQLGTGNLMF